MFKIDTTGAIKATDKAKQKARTTAAGGPSFADMLEDAQQVESPAQTTPIVSTGALAAGFIPLENEDDLPKDTHGQARSLLQTLKDLASDALSGTPTAALPQLQALAEAQGIDESTLSPTQKTALNEARTRAAVEAAKLKG